MPRAPSAAALFLTPVVWGATFPAMKLLLEVLPPLTAMAWSRALGAVTLLLALPLLARQGVSLPPLRAAVVPGILLGGLIFCGYTLQTLGLRLTTATNAGFITGLYVVFTPLLALLLFREPASKAAWAAVLMSVAGLSLLSLRRLEAPALHPGDLLVLASAVAWAGQAVALGRFAPRLASTALALTQMSAAALLHVVAAAGPGAHTRDALGAWPLLLVTGVAGSGLAFSLQVVAQREVNATRAVIVLAGESLAAAAFAGVWIHERLVPHQWVGAGLVLGAMTLSELGARRAAAAHLAPGSAP